MFHPKVNACWIWSRDCYKHSNVWDQNLCTIWSAQLQHHILLFWSMIDRGCIAARHRQTLKSLIFKKLLKPHWKISVCRAILRGKRSLWEIYHLRHPTDHKQHFPNLQYYPHLIIRGILLQTLSHRRLLHQILTLNFSLIFSRSFLHLQNHF